MNKFLLWLKSLTDFQKSQVRRPLGMSRRGFLRAMGITAVTVAGGGLLLAKGSLRPGLVKWTRPDLSQDAIDELIYSTLEELGQVNFRDFSTDLQQHVAMKKLLSRKSAYVEEGPGIVFHLPVSPNHRFEAVLPIVGPNYKPRKMMVCSNA